VWQAYTSKSSTRRPLRKLFIQIVAQELNLIFLSSLAAVVTIRSMHLDAEGAVAAHGQRKLSIIPSWCICCFVSFPISRLEYSGQVSLAVADIGPVPCYTITR
jgi:hypothetical protein